MSNDFINPFEALPGANLLCECFRPTHKNGSVFQARLIMNVEMPRGFMWLQPNNVVSGPDGLFWRYVIGDPEERRQEASLWFDNYTIQGSQG